MHHPTLFWNTVRTLSEAYARGWLTKSSSEADVLGVILAKANDIQFSRDSVDGEYRPTEYRILVPHLGCRVAIDAWYDMFRTAPCERASASGRNRRRARKPQSTAPSSSSKFEFCQLTCPGMPQLPGVPQREQLRLTNVEEERVYALLSTTGRPVNDLRRIEYAFESNTKVDACLYGQTDRRMIEQDLRRGLMGVLEVLFELHDVDDCYDQQNAISLFHVRTCYGNVPN